MSEMHAKYPEGYVYRVAVSPKDAEEWATYRTFTVLSAAKGMITHLSKRRWSIENYDYKIQRIPAPVLDGWEDV